MNIDVSSHYWAGDEALERFFFNKVFHHMATAERLTDIKNQRLHALTARARRPRIVTYEVPGIFVSDNGRTPVAG